MYEMRDEVRGLKVEDYKKCLEEMKKAHPFMDDAWMYVSFCNPENWPYIVVRLEVDGTEIELKRKVTKCS